MRTWLTIGFFICVSLPAQQAPIPSADELPGRPFFIRNKWVIGGAGSWDYLALDPAAQQLFIARQSSVQVVDVESGSLLGQVSGFTEAHSIVLDPTGSVGYVSDGRANQVRVFDRRTFRIQASIPLICSPRSMAYEPQQKLLFAMCSSGNALARQPPASGSSTAAQRRPRPAPPQTASSATTYLSHIVVIDPEARTVLANIAAAADFRSAQADENGQIYITVGAVEQTDGHSSGRHWPSRIARLDAAVIGPEAHHQIEAGNRASPDGASAAVQTPLDWSADSEGENRFIRFLPLGQSCPSPQGLAVDSRMHRLFVACDNQQMVVLDSSSGSVVTTLTTGPGTDALAYDSNRGLIFAANGGGYGSLTILREHVTDTYSVIQNLPTMQNARTLAVDPSTGLVYLVTTLYGAKLGTPPVNGIGTLTIDAVDSSFQVLVVGN